MTHGPRTAAQYTGCAVLGPIAGPGARPGHITESGRAAGPQGARI
jgi:hypothetical protein